MSFDELRFQVELIRVKIGKSDGVTEQSEETGYMDKSNVENILDIIDNIIDEMEAAEENGSKVKWYSIASVCMCVLYAIYIIVTKVMGG